MWEAAIIGTEQEPNEWPWSKRNIRSTQLPICLNYEENKSKRDTTLTMDADVQDRIGFSKREMMKLARSITDIEVEVNHDEGWETTTLSYDVNAVEEEKKMGVSVSRTVSCRDGSVNSIDITCNGESCYRLKPGQLPSMRGLALACLWAQDPATFAFEETEC